MKTREPIILLYILIIFSLLFGLTHCGTSYVLPGPPEEPIHDTLIVPGKRIGPLSLGMNAGQLLKTMGSPISTRRLADSNIYIFSGEITAIVLTDNNKVIKVSTRNSRYATSEGLRAGTDDLNVRAVMGAPSTLRNLRHTLSGFTS